MRTGLTSQTPAFSVRAEPFDKLGTGASKPVVSEAELHDNDFCNSLNLEQVIRA